MVHLLVLQGAEMSLNLRLNSFGADFIKFDSKKIKNKIGECGEVTVLTTVDSTNTYAKKKCFHGIADRSVIIAENQTAGRGRQGKQFYSPDGGLYMTVVFNADGLKSDDIQLLTVYVSVAVSEAIDDVCNAKTGIKWVNDIFVSERKVCGILCEAVFNQKESRVRHYIAGIGINVGEKEFPVDLKNIAGHVKCINGDINDLAAAVIVKIFDILDTYSRDSVLEKYRSKMFLLGKQISFTLNDMQYFGIAHDINQYGNLIVQCGEEYITLSSGEVSLGSSEFTK